MGLVGLHPKVCWEGGTGTVSLTIGESMRGVWSLLQYVAQQLGVSLPAWIDGLMLTLLTKCSCGGVAAWVASLPPPELHHPHSLALRVCLCSSSTPAAGLGLRAVRLQCRCSGPHPGGGSLSLNVFTATFQRKAESADTGQCRLTVLCRHTLRDQESSPFFPFPFN